MELKDYVNMKVTGTPWKDQEVETVSEKESDIQTGVTAANKLDVLAKAKMREVIINELKNSSKSDMPDLGGVLK